MFPWSLEMVAEGFSSGTIVQWAVLLLLVNLSIVKNVIKSNKFQLQQIETIEIPNKFNKIYEECLGIYKELNQYSIKV